MRNQFCVLNIVEIKQLWISRNIFGLVIGELRGLCNVGVFLSASKRENFRSDWDKVVVPKIEA